MTAEQALDSIIFENDRYAVTIGQFPNSVELHGGHYDGGYIITNKETGVQEVYTAQYPDAIAAAEQLDISVEQAVWKWIRINHETDQVEKGEAEAPVQH